MPKASQAHKATALRTQVMQMAWVFYRDALRATPISFSTALRAGWRQVTFRADPALMAAQARLSMGLAA